jgi:hypothetical protein
VYRIHGTNQPSTIGTFVPVSEHAIQFQSNWQFQQRSVRGLMPLSGNDCSSAGRHLARLYAGLENAMREWREDLCHVALRIRAREEGTLDPGTLLEAQIKRKQEKGQDERDIAASTPRVPRTKRQQEKVKKERIDE